MSVISFGVINKDRAREEGIRIVLSRGSALLFHRVLCLVDSYCINPSCDCEAAHLDVHCVDGKIQGFEEDPASRTLRSSGEKAGYKADILEKPVPLVVYLPRGTVDFPKGHEAKAGEIEIREQVREGLIQERLEILRRHYRESKEWACDNYWKHADWSYLREGMCVGWAEVFPREVAWTFEEEGATYLADDQYCVNPSCSCEEAILTFFERGIAAANLHRLDSVVTDETWGAKLDPKNQAQWLAMRSFAESASGRYDAALADAEAAVRLEPTRADAWLALAKVKESLNHPSQDGLPDYERAARLSPTFAQALPGCGGPCPGSCAASRP